MTDDFEGSAPTSLPPELAVIYDLVSYEVELRLSAVTE